MTEGWTDPRPQFPTGLVLVRGDDGSVRYALHNKYGGWETFPGGFKWSMAHPVIVGWKKAHWPPQTEEEWEAGTRGMPQERIDEWRKACNAKGQPI